MDTLNIIDRTNKVESQIAEVEKQAKMKIDLITSKFSMIDAQFEMIYKRSWRKTLDFAREKQINPDSEDVKKATEINERIGDKIALIKEEARKKIAMIKEEEKQRKIADLDNLVNDICK